MLVTDTGGKEFEKPKSGIYNGTIIDVIDLGLVKSKNPQFPDPKVRIRIVWVLGQTPGGPTALDTEGKPFRVIEQPTAKISSGGVRPSRLYEICVGVLGTEPPVPFDTEVLIGKSNQLFLTQEGEFVNIKGFLPLPAGSVAPVAPAGFLRAKDKPKTAGPATTSASSFTGAPAASAPTPAVNLGTPAQQAAVAASAAAPTSDEDTPF